MDAPCSILRGTSRGTASRAAASPGTELMLGTSASTIGHLHPAGCRARVPGRPHLAGELRPRRRGGPHTRHRGAARAHGHEEHAPVVLLRVELEQAPRLRLREADVVRPAVTDLVHGPGVRVPEVVAEHRRRAGEGAARLRAAARRAGALALVVAALVVGDVGLAAVRAVGAEDLVPADDIFQSGVAAVGAVVPARVALVLWELAMAVAASQVPGIALHK